MADLRSSGGRGAHSPINDLIKHAPSLGVAGVIGVMHMGCSTSFVSGPRGDTFSVERRATHVAEPVEAAPNRTSQPYSHLRSGSAVGTLLGAALVAHSARARVSARTQASQSGTRQVALAAFEKELGVQAPLGFWDPAGFALDGDAAAFKRRRAIEIKHGRIAMIACMGYITPEFVKFPGVLSPHLDLKFSDVPNGLAALSKVPTAGWAQWFLFCGVIDNAFLKEDPARAAGDFERAGALGVPNGGVKMKDDGDRSRKLNSELANGRLAMMAIMGMFFQDGLSGQAWGDWSLYTSSPLRATTSEEVRSSVTALHASEATVTPAPFNPSSQSGAIEPLGYWDPFGLSDTEEQFRAYRSAEIKHGRFAMMAVVGLVAQHFVQIPGFGLISRGGMNAMTEYPGSAGLGLLFLLVGYFELEWTDAGREPGNYGDPAEFRKYKFKDDKEFQNYELNNGRLAMFGFMGTICAEYTTGTDAVGQWAAAKPAAIDFIQKTIPWAS